MSSKKKVIFYGNCQLAELIEPLKHHAEFQEKYQIVKCRRFRWNFYVAQWRKSDTKKLLNEIKNVDVFVHQSVSGSVLGEELSSENLSSIHSGKNIWTTNFYFRGYESQIISSNKKAEFDGVLFYLFSKGYSKKDAENFIENESMNELVKYTKWVVDTDIHELKRREDLITDLEVLSILKVFEEWQSHRLCLWKMHPSRFYFFHLCNKFLRSLQLDELSHAQYFSHFKNNKWNHPRELEYSFVKRMCPDINFEEDYPPKFYGDCANTRFSSNSDYINYYYNIYKNNEHLYKALYSEHKINTFLPIN
jgi:hypothetical protein